MDRMHTACTLAHPQISELHSMSYRCFQLGSMTKAQQQKFYHSGRQAPGCPGYHPQVLIGGISGLVLPVQRVWLRRRSRRSQQQRAPSIPSTH